MRTDSNYIPFKLKQGWRKKLLGRKLLKLLENREEFYITIRKNKFTLRVKSQKPIFWHKLINAIKKWHNTREKTQS